MDTHAMIRKWGPEVGDVFDPTIYGGNEEDAELLLPGFTFVDLGMLLNEKEGHTFWHPDEMVQAHGVVRGVEVWIESIRGRYAMNGRRGFRVAFGAHPKYSDQVDVQEAARLLRENIPPVEYVQVMPEEWAKRREA